MGNSALSYCGELVREQDPDRFLLSMFCRADVREALWALFAFNHEIAKTREVVSETQLGLIRLQWWRDAIGGIYENDEVLEHEVLKPLAEAIKAYDLSRAFFDELIYAREFDLEDVLPAHLEGLLIYADHTNAPLMKLVMQVMGDDPEGEPVQAIAVNYALAGVLRGVPYMGSQRRCYLPEDLLKIHGQSVNQLYEGKIADGLPDVVRMVAEQAVSGVKAENRYLQVSNKLALMYLGQLKRCKYDVFHPRMQVEPAFKVLRLNF